MPCCLSQEFSFSMNRESPEVFISFASVAGHPASSANSLNPASIMLSPSLTPPPGSSK